MAWLNLELPLHDELEVEKQARALQQCEDLEQLQTVAVSLLRFAALRESLFQQVLEQLADAEAMLMQAGIDVDQDGWEEWVAEHYPDHPGG
jgi:hypothetical protein